MVSDKFFLSAISLTRTVLIGLKDAGLSSFKETESILESNPHIEHCIVSIDVSRYDAIINGSDMRRQCELIGQVLARSIIGDKQMWPYHFTGFGKPVSFLQRLPIHTSIPYGHVERTEGKIALRVLGWYNIESNDITISMDCFISRD